jgi:hypothetical protein
MNDPSLQKIYYNIDNFDTSISSGIDNVSNLNIIKTTSFADNFVLGGLQSAYAVNSPEQIEVSFDRSFIRPDFLFNYYTGDNFIYKLYVYNPPSYYQINNLYLTQYSANFSVGDVPKINAKFTSYGENINQTTAPINTSNDTTLLEIPKLNSILISGDSSSQIKDIYNILSIDYSMQFNRQPFFNIGSNLPTQVYNILPIKINLSITSKLKDEAKAIAISTPIQSELNFDIVISGTNTMIYPIRKAQLLSTEITSSSQNTMDVKHNFLGFYGL